jgi:photosystem II stability/assembly factor-like uncharacterized protein
MYRKRMSCWIHSHSSAVSHAKGSKQNEPSVAGIFTYPSPFQNKFSVVLWNVRFCGISISETEIKQKIQMKSISTLCIFIVMIGHAFFSNAQWQQTNGPHGGYVSCYANNDDEIYVGTQYGGVFRSTNNGESWTARNNGLRSYDINCIAMDNDNLYVGTRLGGFDGVHHSIDDGATWETYPNLWTSYEPSCIAASDDNIFVGTAGGGNFFSHDAGLTWASSLSGVVPYQYYSTSQILILEDKVLTIINGRLYESLDGALTYSLLMDGFAEGAFCSQIAKAGPNLFATTTGGFYTSTDGGNFWVDISAQLPEPPNYMAMSTAESFIYITGGTTGLPYFSNNNGYDWLPVNTDWGTGMNSFYALANGKLLIQSGYYAADYSVFDSPQLHYTGDNGNTWADVTNEITSTWCLSMTAHGNDVYVGTQFTGMYKTTDEGDNWEASPTPDYWVSLGTLATFGNTILASGDGGILRSVDSGETWTDCNQGLLSVGVGNFAQVGTDIFAANSLAVMVSTDDGQTWSVSNNGMEGQNVSDIIAIDNILYAVSPTGVYKSVNFGNSWNLISIDLPSDLSLHKIGHIGNVLFVTSANSGTMYKSTDGGVSWTSINLDIYEAPSSFAVHDNMLFVSVFANVSGSGVFMTNDLGETWTDVSEGLDNNQVWDIIVNNGWAYVCTKGCGVYKRHISDFMPQNVTSKTQTDISIYPNPANDRITLSIPSRLIGNEAMITNELGQQVMTIGNITSTNFQVDCNSLAPGYYIMRIGSEKVKFVIE